jgi:hypothetical protein
MNERILELADKAVEDMPSGPWNIPDEFCKKFAELIVRECIDIIAPYTVRMSRPGEEYLHPISEIKKNFGVEE